MSSLRQMGSGLLYAVVSVVLVVGGLSLALAEGGFNSGRPTSTVQPSPTLLLPSASPTEESTATQATSSTSTPIIATATSLPSSTPQVILPTPTTAATATRYYPPPLPTSTRTPYHTAVPCGPYSGWLRSYVVQPGDTLYHIATQYQTTVNALQTANCKSTTVIFPGERLWVPSVATITPGVTLIPTFPTSTAVPTEPPTYTPVPPPTDTAVPTDTTVPNP